MIFCRLKKNVGGRISPAIPGNVRTFPGMLDRKTAEVGKNPLGPIGWGGGGGKFVIWIFFGRLGGQNVGWKKNVGWIISPAIPGNVRTFPGMQDRKTAEAGKNG